MLNCTLPIKLQHKNQRVNHNLLHTGGLARHMHPLLLVITGYNNIHNMYHSQHKLYTLAATVSYHHNMI